MLYGVGLVLSLRRRKVAMPACAFAGVSAATDYSKKVSQFRLARAAMEQFEAGWEKLRPSVLGNVEVVK